MSITRTHVLIVALITLLILLVISGVNCFDGITWLLEIFPLLIAWPLLCVTYRRYPLTTLLYICIFMHSLILLAGGAYTYARVPLGFEIAELLHINRNPYDKIGHFFQGLVPTLLAREIFMRGQFISGKNMLEFIVVCVALAISASYELIEWAAAMLLGQGADEFLGTQGYQWDTQSDMFYALLGSLFVLVVLARLQDRQIQRLQVDGHP